MRGEPVAAVCDGPKPRGRAHKHPQLKEPLVAGRTRGRRRGTCTVSREHRGRLLRALQEGWMAADGAGKRY